MSSRVVIADDRKMIQAGFRRIFEGSDIEICCEAGTLHALEVCLKQELPQVLIAEIQLGGADFLAALPPIRRAYPQVAVFVFSDSKNPVHEAKAFTAGAAGFRDRGISSSELLAAVRTIAGGGQLWTVTDQRRLGNYTREADQSVGELAPLTPRELQVLKLLTTGATNKDISESLSISHETVKEHVQHVLEKLALNDRTQAAVWAVRNKIV